MRQIEVSVDVFAAIWAARLPVESTENEILTRILKLKRLSAENGRGSNLVNKMNLVEQNRVDRILFSQPKSKKWTDVLIWTLSQFGGRATLGEIYSKSREGRAALGYVITPQHDASARECLESHCRESEKFRHRADLFYMPEGKGAGVWALR